LFPGSREGIYKTNRISGNVFLWYGLAGNGVVRAGLSVDFANRSQFPRRDCGRAKRSRFGLEVRGWDPRLSLDPAGEGLDLSSYRSMKIGGERVWRRCRQQHSSASYSGSPEPLPRGTGGARRPPACRRYERMESWIESMVPYEANTIILCRGCHRDVRHPANAGGVAGEDQKGGWHDGTV